VNLFAVIRTRGGGWQHSMPLEQQRDWDAHAAFMNDLYREGFILLGGPLEDAPDVLLIVRASTVNEIIGRLASDPWSDIDLLTISRVMP
jgi:uncharacterized protein YciI